MQRSTQFANGALTGLAPSDYFSQQWIVKWRDLLALFNAYIVTHVFRVRWLPAKDFTGLWHKVLPRVFCIQAHFNSVATKADIVLCQR